MNETIQHKKTLGQRDIVLFSVSAILLLDTLAAGAIGGPSVIVWWLLLGLIFFIPNALITAELGCTFPEQGGIYAWVRDAFGERWAARVTWSYWVNMAVWLPAIYILFAGIFAQLFMPELSLNWQIAIAVALSWATVGVNVLALEIGKWIPNVGAIIKVTVFVVIIAGGFFHAFSEGSANEFSASSMMPNLGDSLQYLGVLIYGMLGFELISASSEDMKDPMRDVPRGIFVSGFIIISLYTLATAAILVAVPAEEIDLVEGLMDTLYLLLGDSAAGRGFVLVLGVGTLYTFFSNGTTWALGGNRAAAEAAMAGELPNFMGVERESNGSPIGAAVSLGVVATVVLLLFGMLAGTNEDLFWDLFAFSAVLFLLPYVGQSLAFLKLRELYPERERPFRVPGGDRFACLCAYTCTFILVCSMVLFCYTPGTGMQWSVFLGSAILMALGEGFIRWTESNASQGYMHF